jgi:hypothetical protein
MKLSRLAVTPEGVFQTIHVTTDEAGLPTVTVTPTTQAALLKVVETYNAVVEAAEGSNHLPYQMTFQLLKESDIAEPVA